MTKPGYAIGTFAYIAPERLGTRAHEDARADIYSLACVLYECLTGSPPFDADTIAGLVAAHLHTAPPQPSATQPNVPKQIDEVIAKGMAKDPDRRYQTALQFAASAQSALTEPVTADSPESTPLDVEFEVLEDYLASDQRRLKNRGASVADRPGVEKGTAVMAIVVAVFVVVVLGIVIATPRVKQETSGSASQISIQTPASKSKPVTSATAAPPSLPAPAPPVIPATSVDSILLSSAEVNQVAGASHMRLKDSQYGVSDNAGGVEVKPADCAGVVHGADRTVWADTGFESIRDQTYTPDYPGVPDSAGMTPSQIEQVVVVFPSPEQAQAVLASAQRQWQSCAGGTVSTVYNGIGESTRGYTLGPVQRQGDVISVSMAAYSNLNGADACQQVLGVRINVAVRTGSCTQPNVTNPNAVASPTWAIDYAERLAMAMLTRVKT